MAVRRSQNWLNQQRVDVPHLRSIESAVRNDFDELLSAFTTGIGSSYIIRGFEIDTTNVPGGPASGLEMVVAESALFHGNSLESGTFFQVPSGTSNEVLSAVSNEKVDGSFTFNSLNYVGIEFTRQVDTATASQVFFWNPTNNTEFSKTTPLAQTFDYKIVITSSIWASNVLPIAIVDVNTSGNVVSIEDRRPMLFRLGTAGSSTPNPFYSYAWSNHSEGREENPALTTSSISPFKGGDKQLFNLKEWMDAVMTSIKEIKGTSYWYEGGVSGSLETLRNDLKLLQLTGSGDFSHSATTPGQINWSSDLFLNFIGSRLRYRINANTSPSGDVTLADGQVAYIQLVREEEVLPELVFSNTLNTVTSVGAVAWTDDVSAGDYIKLAADGDDKYFEIASVTNASEVELTEVFYTNITAKAHYAYGTYGTTSTVTSLANPALREIFVDDRKDVPLDQDIYWLFLREDSGTTPAKLYIKGSTGGELEQGEDRPISDNTTTDVLTYIGALSEVDEDPDYTNALTAGQAQRVTLTFPAGSAFSTFFPNDSFNIKTALDLDTYDVYAIVNGIDQPARPPGDTPVGVTFLSTDTATTVAAAYEAELINLGFSVNNLGGGQLEVTNAQVGACTAPSIQSMPAGFNISVDQPGVGAFNFTVVDNENLTQAIKRLDEALIYIDQSLDIKPYKERVDLLASSPGAIIYSDLGNSILAPTPVGFNYTIPPNFNNNGVQESYTVGRADLEIFLNGVRLAAGSDYTEINPIQVEFNLALQAGDVLIFTKASSVTESVSGSGSAAGVNLGPAQDADVFKQNSGNQLQFRRLAAGSGVSITENADNVVITSTPTVANQTVVTINGTNHTILASEDVILVLNSGIDVTITLPDASLVAGKVINIKKIDAGNTMFIKSISGQTLDGDNIDAAPKPVSVQYENVTVVSSGTNWFIL